MPEGTKTPSVGAIYSRLVPFAERNAGRGPSWQSLVRETDSVESDYLTGEIVLQGRLHGVSTPVNELLQRLAN